MTSYEEWKTIMDAMYGGKISDNEATDQLIALLAKSGIYQRSTDHDYLAASYFVYNKEDWAAKERKPLGLGLIYKKPNGVNTQDIFIANPDSGSIERYYSESEMVRKYPSMAGVHKDDHPIK